MENDLKALWLDKYRTDPALVRLTAQGLLECSGVHAARNVADFDAATDSTGAIHCIFYTNDGTLTYFRTENDLPVCKTLSKNTDPASIQHLSMTELEGMLHLCIALKRNGLQLHHYYSKGSAWQSGAPKSLPDGSTVPAAAPCPEGGFAVLVSRPSGCCICPNRNGHWLEDCPLYPPMDWDDVLMECESDRLELLWHIGSRNTYGRSTVPLKDLFIPERNKNAMSNGNILLAKHVTQLQEMQKQIDALLPLAQEVEKLNRLCGALSDTVRNQEAQLTRMSMRIQEQANRITALTKHK